MNKQQIIDKVDTELIENDIKGYVVYEENNELKLRNKKRLELAKFINFDTELFELTNEGSKRIIEALEIDKNITEDFEAISTFYNFFKETGKPIFRLLEDLRKEHSCFIFRNIGDDSVAIYDPRIFLAEVQKNSIEVNECIFDNLYLEEINELYKLTKEIRRELKELEK